MESIKVIRKYEKEVQNIQEGDQILISLAEVGEFTATAYKVTDKGVLFIFDEYVASQPMNNKNTNKGGFEKSDLKKWMDSVLFMAFPDWLRDRITDLSIPTVGEMFGHEDEWDNDHFEPDTDEQLPLMGKRKNRVAYLNNEWEWGWLRNAMKKEYSSAYFAVSTAMAMRTTATLRTLTGFVQSSGWLSKNLGALCPTTKNIFFENRKEKIPC